MSLWTRVGDALAGGREAVSSTFDGIAEFVRNLASSEARRQVAFTIAIIALSAKMAKADGIVTQDEVSAFRAMFKIPQGEEKNVARVFNIAKSGTGGFDSYARDIAKLYRDDPDFLEDILDGLFHIAKADGLVHERETEYLRQVAGIFGFDDVQFSRICGRHALAADADPYLVLGADPDWDFERLRGHYRKLVKDNHPDRLISRGVPEEFIRIGTERLAAINAAWETIEAAYPKQ